MKYYSFTILVMFEGEDVNRMFENIIATCAQDAANDIAEAYGTPCRLMSNIRQKEV